MINKRKVRLMARTAMYVKHEGAEDLPKAKYYKSDYVGLHVWTTAVAVTVAYLLILILLASCNFENIINNLTSLNYTAVIIVLALAYVAMMVFFLVTAYFVYSYRYVQAENGIKIYRSRLHKIFQMNKAGRKTGEEIGGLDK